MATLSELFKNRNIQLPYGAGSYMSPVPAGNNTAHTTPMFNLPPGASTTTSVTPTIRTATPPAPNVGGDLRAAGVPPEMINPQTGGIYSPQDMVNNTMSNLPDWNMQGSGDIPQYAGDTLMERAYALNNARNDIAVGETDPYRSASQSNMRYSPEDLKAIEKAYAGIYDPALKDLFGRIDAQEKQAESERQYQNELKLLREKYKLEGQLDAAKRAGAGESSLNSGALVGQPGYDKLTAKQKSQADSVNNLVRALNEYKTTINSDKGLISGSGGGVNLFGADSALLETQLNSIIFAAAQAEGTGALQKADRDVIERIIPNLTTIGGAFNNLTKGGLDGVIDKIDNQIGKYISNLAGYGLTPSFTTTGEVQSAPRTVGGGDLPETMILNGRTLYLQEDGTYE